MIETMYSKNMQLCYIRTHSPLITSTRARSRYFAVVIVLNTYVVHDSNSLNAYTLCTVHEQDSVVVRHKRTNYTCSIALVLYST